MKIITEFNTEKKSTPAVLTIGTFDGVHLGHQKILNQLQYEANLIDGESFLFTFFPHPRLVLNPESEIKLLQTQIEKLNKLERFGLQNCVIYPFDQEFANLSADEFISDVLLKYWNIKKIVIGYDHQFGKDRKGNIDYLKELGEKFDFEVIEISAELVDDINVSSTKIRNALLAGEVHLANDFLGEPFEISGKVVHGDALGRTIGYPTANIDIADPYKIIPKVGVYAVEINGLNQKFYGMLNIGFRPTINQSQVLKIEVHIFDFNQNIYGQNIVIALKSYIRDEQRFLNVEALQEQLKEDEKSIRSYFFN